MNIQSTKDLQKHAYIHAIVYGKPGVGKTRMIATMPKPFVLSSEGGLLSIKDATIDYASVKTMAEYKECIDWLANSQDALQYESVAIDSLSELAELVLDLEKGLTKNGMKAYGVLMEEMYRAGRTIKTIKKHVMVIAKSEMTLDETEGNLWGPLFPGRATGPYLSGLFDYVLPLRANRDADGHTWVGLRCHKDGGWLVKDRSNLLAEWEKPCFSHLIKKLKGESNG